MNPQQWQQLFQVLLAAGGPVGALLAQAGLPAGTVSSLLQIALLIVPPLASGIWALVTHTDHNVIAAASQVPGVEKITIAADAKDGAAAAAASADLPTVNKES